MTGPAQDGTWLALVGVAGVGLLSFARPDRGSAVRRNEEIADAWGRGYAAKGNRTHTDGRTLWSYDLIIGETDAHGRKIVYDYTYKGGHSRSKTTGRIVNLAKQWADKVVSPAYRKIPRITGYRPTRD